MSGRNKAAVEQGLAEELLADGLDRHAFGLCGARRMGDGGMYKCGARQTFSSVSIGSIKGGATRCRLWVNR